METGKLFIILTIHTSLHLPLCVSLSLGWKQIVFFIQISSHHCINNNKKQMITEIYSFHLTGKVKICFLLVISPNKANNKILATVTSLYTYTVWPWKGIWSDLVTQPRRWYWLELVLCTSQYIIIIYTIKTVAEISEKLFKYPPLHLNGFCVWVWKKNLQKMELDKE